jgi:hypothetical protein
MREDFVHVKFLLERVGGGSKSNRNWEHANKLLNIFMFNSFIWFASLSALSFLIPLD